MTEKPILFSAPMVRAILAGRKTQTRRIQNGRNRYSVGDRLWVRETHAWADKMAEGVEREDPVCVAYRADQTAISHEHENVHALDTTGWNWERFKWRPSIFMPRWASRITLDVTAVRVERLQEITQEDAIAEGVGELGWIVPRQREREAFSELWDSINAKRAAWASNPWVAVVTFKLAARRAPVEEG